MAETTNSKTRTKKPVVKKATDVGSRIVPVQLQRIRQDVLSWREAYSEMELAYFPHRIKQQRLLADTELNGHVEACMNKRRNLTLLRDFVFNEDEEFTTTMFKKQWFYNCLSHIIDALFYGYNLVSLGDVVGDEFPNIDVIKRWNVSPDRLITSRFMYMTSGDKFLEGEFKKWHVYVSTPGNNGVSKCGYGLLSKVAIYEIFCRNILGFNGDFVELYAQPYRVGKSLKTEGAERDALAQALRDMGSNGWAIIDPTDEIAFLETALGGTGYKGYESLEKRCEDKISKILLGHADAIDSVPGKLGNDGEKSPAQKSLEEIQVTDGRFAENIINGILLPNMREIGFSIPEGNINFKNDSEKHEIREREDKSNAKVAEIASIMSKGGLEMDAAYFTERTGIPCKAVQRPMGGFPQKTMARLKEIYK